MGEKIVVGPVNKGLINNRTAFVIDNDAFPVLKNAYQWRGRVKRKRGTQLLGRLTRFFNSALSSYGSTTSFNLSNGIGNLLTAFGLQVGSLVPGTINFTDSTTSVNYTDDSMGNLVGGAGGTVDYASGIINVTGGGNDTINAVSFLYNPMLPVMGLEDFISKSTQFPGTLAFDTKYSYEIQVANPYGIYDVSFYKNPPLSGSLTGYVPKTNLTPLTWNGEDYRQFWTVNYEGALWATNGVSVQFDSTKIGMQFANAASITSAMQINATTVDFTITGSPLVVGDFVFANEFTGNSGPTLNLQTGYVTMVSGTTYRVVFPYANIGGSGLIPGILQYLTNRSDKTKDCIRWFDGDPTNGSATNPGLVGLLGWVNFMPPLSNAPYSISDLPAAIYYLVGCKIIIPFKDFLLFFGPVVQASSGPSIYLSDSIVFSQNGTPYYTSSFAAPAVNYPLNPTTPPGYFPMLVPVNQTATPTAYIEDITGFGGSMRSGIDQEILTVGANEDVLIVGFTRAQGRLIFSGSNILPFVLYLVNSELGSGSTFSAVVMDEGVISRGSRGHIMTNQNSATRIDLDIPDEIFESQLINNGTERVCSQRDFINEWIYFTYPVNDPEISSASKFPNQTLLYNYRDNSWGIFLESYTTYGAFRKLTGLTWATVGMTYPTWDSWNDPWNAGDSTLLQPLVIAGNQQGFVLFRVDGTGEGNSLYITNISFPATITGATQAVSAVLTANNQFVVGQLVMITGVVGMTQLNGNTYPITAVTPTTITLGVNSTGFTPYISGGIATPIEPIYCPNHGLNQGDYITISGALGTISSQINGNIFSVALPTVNGFTLNPPITSGTYFGGGLITRFYVPLIQSKQFPTAWALGRKTRLGAQQYLLTTTSSQQITLLIFLSQDGSDGWNSGPIVPDPNSNNDALIYSTVLYTCPESTNLGLTPANVNLQMPTASSQQQIWHRINTSLLGDTVQVGFTMSDTQMRDSEILNQVAEIEIHGFILDCSPSQMLA